MQVIPVIDLKGGVVVGARMGRRDQYRPIETPLSPTSDSIDVTRGLLSVHPFKTLYVADLDAIEGRDDHRAVLAELNAAFPQLTLWVDNGIADLRDAECWLDRGRGHLVLGSESQTDAAVVRHFAGHERVALSLDFRDDQFLGPPALLADTAYWPRDVIVMTLARVGGAAGPDLERLSAIARTAPEARIHAAGGVRDAADLAALANAGVAGALVASALHDGRLTADDLGRL
jgi:phosphoribosylformimino-5-aminoimidazole carboxamide ribotide isomerase